MFEFIKDRFRHEDPPFVAETLKWCNEMRELEGIEPVEKIPKGIPGDAASCPCGKASGWRVGSGIAWKFEKDVYRAISLPCSVQIFVKEFDGGKLPQYEL